MFFSAFCVLSILTAPIIVDRVVFCVLFTNNVLCTRLLLFTRPPGVSSRFPSPFITSPLESLRVNFGTADQYQSIPSLSLYVCFRVRQPLLTHIVSMIFFFLTIRSPADLFFCHIIVVNIITIITVFVYPILQL